MAQKECCTKEENLSVIETRPDLVVKKCSVCGCRQFEVTIEVGHIGIFTPKS